MAARAEMIGLPRGPEFEGSWRWIDGFRGLYAVSDRGRVASLRGYKWRILSGGRGTQYGHRKVALGTRDGCSRWVHRLVLEAFVGPAPDGAVARHLDGDPTNNSLDNLAWGTHADNGSDTVQHGRSTRGVRNPGARLSEDQVRQIRRDLAGGATGVGMAAKYGISGPTVSQIKTGRLWGWLDAG